MKLYGVCIGKRVCEDSFMFCKARNKTEARKEGMTYKRAWKIPEPILKIVEIPESVGDDSVARRKYAVAAQ